MAVLFTNKDLRNLIIPLFWTSVLFTSVGVIDSMMVATLGAASVSGVSMVDMINVLLGSMLVALGTGGAVVASQYLGAGRHRDANDSARQLLMLTEFTAICFMFFCLIFKRQILHLVFGKMPEEVEKEALSYFSFTAFMYLFLGINASCTAILRSIDRARCSMIAALIVNIVNIIFNWLFIFIFHWGVAGAAISTVIARFFAAIYLLIVISDRNNKVYVALRNGWNINKEKIRKILFIGIPSGFENGIFTLGRLLVIGVVTKFGTEQLAANSVANSITSLTCIMGNTFSLAMIPVVGRAVGTGDMQKVKYYVKKMSIWAWVAFAIWTLLIWSLVPCILSFYTKLSPEVKHLIWVLFSIHASFGILMWSLSFTFPCALRATNDVKFTMWVSILSMIIVRIGCAYFFGQYLVWGVIGTWLAMVCDWVVRISFFLPRYRSGAWQKYALSALK